MIIMTIKKRSSRSDQEKELDKLWGIEAKAIIKSKMALSKVNTIELAEILTAAGRPSSAQGLRKLLSGGKFKAAWFLHVKNLLENISKNN